MARLYCFYKLDTFFLSDSLDILQNILHIAILSD